jgi:hypothetical protein
MSLSAILGHRMMFSECWTRDLLHEPPAGALAAASPRTRFNNSRGGAFVDSGLLGTESRRVGPQLIHDAGSSERRPPSSPYTL